MKAFAEWLSLAFQARLLYVAACLCTYMYTLSRHFEKIITVRYIYCIHSYLLLLLDRDVAKWFPSAPVDRCSRPESMYVGAKME